VDPSGSRSRADVIPGVGSFKLHGVGCRFEFESGAEVDFDWDREDRPTFDRFRVIQFARSLGSEVSASDVDVALRALRSAGVLSGGERDEHPEYRVDHSRPDATFP
jgi:hypothetical protein